MCASILPLPDIDQDFIPCVRCPFKRDIKEFETVLTEFTIYYNTPSQKKSKDSTDDSLVPETDDREEQSQGPTVERNCPKCNYDIMTYTTRQTRSDEGQTVFYTCVKCKFQDI